MLLRHLFEAANNEVAIIFGRFNPPHKGHRAAWEMASKSPIWYVGTNESTVGPKDPLPFDVKVEAMKTVWPDVESHIVAETSWLTLASEVYEKYPKATLLCLTDEDWVTKTIIQYNGKEGAHGFYNFPNIKQKPTPRLSSATALRDAVAKGDRDAFTQAAGVSADTKVAGKPFFDLVAEYLLPYQNAPKKAPAKKKKEPAVAEGGAWHNTPQSAMIGINGKKTMAKSASDSKYSDKSFTYQGHTIKFKPNKREIYKGGDLLHSKDGDYSNPTKKHLSVAHADVGRLMAKRESVDLKTSLQELSNDMLGRYKKAAGADASKADKEGDFKRGDKRFSGIVKATKKQFDNDTKGKK